MRRLAHASKRGELWFVAVPLLAGSLLAACAGVEYGKRNSDADDTDGSVSSVPPVPFKPPHGAGTGGTDQPGVNPEGEAGGAVEPLGPDEGPDAGEAVPPGGGAGGEASDPGPDPADPAASDPPDPAGGNPGGGDPGGNPGGNPGGGAPVPPVVCNPIGEGLSSVVVNGNLRLFQVQLPADRSRMAMLFEWHGFLEIPDTFAHEIVYDVPSGQWTAFDPNAFPMPLMIVTPYDAKILPPAGLDWDIVQGGVDLQFFDAMMECIHQQFAIDDSRVYSFGFSAGAVFSNLLAAIRPHTFAATISESGTWFNDQAEWADVLIPIIQWQWPAFNVADGGNILLTHGGPNDFATIISLESATQKALPFLYNNGRTVTECQHDFGHTRDPDLTQSMYYDYLWAHQLGSGPVGGLIPSFPVWERKVGSTFCTFHPYP